MRRSTFYASSSRGVLTLATAALLWVPVASYAQGAATTSDSSNNVTFPSSSGGTQGNAMPSATSPALVTPNGSQASGGSSISIPAPPPSATLTNDANQLAAQAEQSAIQAQAEADATQAKHDLEHNRKSFTRAATGLLPLSPDQVRGFMQRLQQTQEAAVPPFEGQPKGKERIVTVSLDPGAEAPMVHLAAGYVTTINILDSTGEPWPILDVGVGGNFDVSPTKADMHIVRIMPLTRYGSGNLSVLLKDLATPVIFRLTADTSSDVDLRFDARIPKFGPGAKIPIVDHSRLEAGDETIMAFLQNLPPKDAKRLKVAGLDGRTMAWALGDHVYVRTPLSLLSPAWNASVNAADGMAVYEIGDAPVLLMSDNGAVMRAHIIRDEDHD